jgi:hypothetical protein
MRDVVTRRAPRYGNSPGVAQDKNGFIRSPEEWRRIPQFPAYEISSYGRVRRSSSGKVLRAWFVRNRYPCLSLRRAGRTIKVSVLRIFAAAFLGGLSRGREFDHRRMQLSTHRAIIRGCAGKPNHSCVYKGVSRARNQKWFACIKINKQTKAIGLFDRAKDAAIAYDAVARGEAAYQNFPEASK